MKDEELQGCIDYPMSMSCNLALRGPKGETGDIGPAGPQGETATVAVGSVVTVEPGSQAAVINSGQPDAAVFDFYIPRGIQGEVTEAELDFAVNHEKRRTRRGYAHRLYGFANHESLIELSDCADFSDFTEITIYGKTTSVGNGEKRPENPFSLGGQMPSNIYVNQEAYPLDLIKPLYSLNDLCDSYDAISGTEKRNLLYVELTGNEDWQRYINNSFRNVYFATIPDAALGAQTSVCSHFLNFDGSWDNGVNSYGIYADHYTIAGRKYFNTGINCPTVEDFKAWLGAEYSAGHPVTLICKRKSEVCVQRTPIDIPQPPLVAGISAEGASLSVKYSKDITTVISGLSAAIADLNQRI